MVFKNGERGNILSSFIYNVEGNMMNNEWQIHSSLHTFKHLTNKRIYECVIIE